MSKFVAKTKIKYFEFAHRHLQKALSNKLDYQPGRILFLYLILYGLVRFGLEFFRIESWFMGKFLSLLMLIIGLAGFFKKG